MHLVLPTTYVSIHTDVMVQMQVSLGSALSMFNLPTSGSSEAQVHMGSQTIHAQITFPNSKSASVSS
jgi:hypothetical protein